MYLEKNSVISALQKSVVLMNYWGKDGPPTKMRCTLKEDIIPVQTDLEEYVPDDQIILAWDVSNRFWRRININWILDFSPEV